MDIHLDTSDSFLCKLMYELVNKPYVKTKQIMKQFILFPKKINGLHIYAYTNDAVSFENAVNDGIHYITSSEGTALKIATE